MNFIFICWFVLITDILIDMLVIFMQKECLYMLCRFYLCLWFKIDPKCQQKHIYYFARIKSRSLIRDSGTVSAKLTRDSIKKITPALGQKSSFCRQCDKIFSMLLVSWYFPFPLFFFKNKIVLIFLMLYRLVWRRTL